MARPLPLPDSHRSGTNGSSPARPASAGSLHLHAAVVDEAHASSDNLELPAEDGAALTENAADALANRGRSRAEDAAAAAELEHIRSENAQLRTLCFELEQALQEAAQQLNPDLEKQIHEYDAVLEEKNDMIRQLHLQLQEVQILLEGSEARAKEAPAPPAPRPSQGPTPGEDELLALSEELERERRQLQEDEQTLMEQMRVMEVSMARERAEMARQRNDLQRLQSEIHEDLKRLERNGASQKKIEEHMGKLKDAKTRRGAAPASRVAGAVISPLRPRLPPPPHPARKQD